jgi:Na+(H+)/acetate symporter ActP
MNSIATTYVTDIHHRLKPDLSDQECLRLARFVTFLVGAVGIATALLMAKTDIRTFYSLFLELIGLFGGALSGLFILGMFFRLASSAGALTGAILSAAIVFTIRFTSPLSVYAYAPIGLVGCVAIGWLASWLFAPNRRDLFGLTIHSLGRVSS